MAPRRTVYRTPLAAGRHTRYKLWTDVGDSPRGKNKRRRAAARKRKSAIDQAWTVITTWLRAVGGTSRRRTTTRRKGGAGNLHPNRFRHRAMPDKPRPVDEVARMRQRRAQRRRNRGRR